MRKNIKIVAYTALSAIILFTSSCKKGFNEVNTDPIGQGKVTANQLLAPALVNVLSVNLPRNRNFNNELMQVTVDISDAEAKVFRYDFRRTWADYTWNAWYLELTNLKDIHTIASQPESLNYSYQAVSLITQAWVFSLLTDMYGDVPYSQANKGREGILEPAFDKQKDIYISLFQTLEEANSLLTKGDVIIATGDPVYQGDTDKWRRFGNSLYLRLLMRASGKAEVKSQVTDKLKEILETKSADYPIIEENSQNARIVWSGSNSSTAVFASPLIANVRAVDFRGPAITEFFLNKLINWGYPTVVQALGKDDVSRWGIAPGANGYVGVPSGYAPGSGIVKQAYFYSDGQTQTTGKGYTLQTDPNTGIILNVAEIDFIKAEAVARGWINGNVSELYYKGIANAIQFWMPTHITGPTDPKFTTFIVNADLEWDNNMTATNDKLAAIHEQKYYALFMVDMQQWFEYRRTGYPTLPTGNGLANGGQMPARMYYPAVVQSTNSTNYKSAIAQQGPDDINTKVWWQKP